MKIVVVGGTGRLGSQVVAELQRREHEAVAAAPSTGVDTISGAGVPEGLAGAQVVVDVSNAPSFEAAAVLQFFQTSTSTRDDRVRNSAKQLFPAAMGRSPKRPRAVEFIVLGCAFWSPGQPAPSAAPCSLP